MKIAAVVYPGMTLLDLVGPIQAWSFMPGYEVQFVAGAPGLVPTDCGLGVQATHGFEQAWSDPDVLFIGGGGGPPIMQAMADARLVAFLADRGARARWVTSVCTGALLLGQAGLLRGYRAATYWSCREQLATFGAVPSDERVCIDRNRLTGGGITSGIDFGLRVAAHWAGDDTGRFLELLMEYAPEPPFGCGRPELAPPATLAAARAMLREAGLAS